MYTYATLQDIQDMATQEGLPLSTLTDAITQRLLSNAQQATATIDLQTSRTFMPLVNTRYYQWDADNFDDAYTLSLGYPLVELTQLEINGSVIDSSTYRTRPRGQYPIWGIQRLRAAGSWRTVYSDYDDEIAVTGIWCDHPDYDRAWIDTLDTVQDAPLSDSATTLTVSDADGIDTTGRTRFSVGQLLRIDDEYLTVINISGNTLTIKRGERRSTATSHTAGATIERFQPKLDIVKATALIAYTTWSGRGKLNRNQERNQTSGTLNIPDEAQTIIAMNRPILIGGV